MRTLTFVLTVIALVLPATASAQDELMETACFDGHTYELWQTLAPISWSDVRTRAEYLGAHMVTVSSAEENRFITELGARHDVLEDTGVLPLNGIDKKTDGTWAWTTKEPMEFSAWRENEPNGGLREYVIEICLRYKCRAGTWNDTSDNLRFRHFVVEYPDVECWNEEPSGSEDTQVD